MITHGSLAHWLALARTSGIGPKTFFKLLQQWGDPATIFSLPTADLTRSGLSPETIASLRTPDWSSIEKEIRWADKPEHHIITFNDPLYPAQLKATSSPPPLLFAKGNAPLLSTQQLAMIGSRNPTPSGRENARFFARELAKHPLTITSGLALGIDGASHQGALDVQGDTIAVLGTGVENIYPVSHKKLAESIAAQGLIISEFPLFTTPSPYNFPRRNRIIAGLSCGILVVEATLKSGSLITARYGLEEGRDIFAIPGSIHNPLTKGCHSLIRQGAKLVETVDDITEELNLLRRTPLSPPAAPNTLPISSEEGHLLRCVDFEPSSIHVIMARSGFSAEEISSKLLDLELRGYIVASAGGYSRLG